MPPRDAVTSIELVLDPVTEQTVRDDWAELARLGFSNGGGHTGPSNRPHLSLAVRSRAGDPAPLRAAHPELPLRMVLAGLVLFPHGDRTVLARAVVPDAALLDLHRRIAEATAGWGETLPHSEPGAWKPHITLARRLRIGDLPRALEVLAPDPGEVSAVGIRVWDAATQTVTDL